MKALTLWQPWATCVAHHSKLVENRTWEPPASVIGQRIAIHAGKRFEREAYEDLVELDGLALPPRAEIPAGAVIATARVAGWVRSEWLVNRCEHPFDFSGLTEEQARSALRSTWWIGPVGWVLDHVIAIGPVPCSGAQGLWSLPPDIERIVLARESDAALLLP